MSGYRISIDVMMPERSYDSRSDTWQIDATPVVGTPMHDSRSKVGR